MRVASGWVWGSAVYSPLMSERITKRSAPMVTATWAARVSFSPMVVCSPISSVETASFSLRMGRAWSSSRRWMVLLTLVDRWGS